MKKINKEIDKFLINNDNLLNLYNENNYKLKILYTQNLINSFMLHASIDNLEKYSYFYNKLYFLGVDKEILNDFDKISKFYNNLESENYEISEGEKPFIFKYKLKEGK